MNNLGITYWITGLSGSGKTTIGRMLYDYLWTKNKALVLLDGDTLRDVYQSFSYTQADRIELTYRNARLCKLLNEQGISTIICCVAMYDECREWNRKNIANYKEIYLNVPIEELIRRDQKGLYSGALSNEIENVMGINMDYEAPKSPDIEINNSGYNSPEKTTQIIIRELGV